MDEFKTLLQIFYEEGITGVIRALEELFAVYHQQKPPPPPEPINPMMLPTEEVHRG